MQDDEILKRLVEEFGVGKWGQIAKMTENFENCPARTGKQCRERWHNHLDPNVAKSSWTEGEKKLIFALQQVYGNQWSKIAEHLPGRSDNSVKNLFYSALRKKERSLKKALKKQNKSEKLQKSYNNRYIHLTNTLPRSVSDQSQLENVKTIENTSACQSEEIEASNILWSLSEKAASSHKNETENMEEMGKKKIPTDSQKIFFNYALYYSYMENFFATRNSGLHEN